MEGKKKRVRKLKAEDEFGVLKDVKSALTWIKLPDPKSLHASKSLSNYLNRLNKAILELRKHVEGK